MKGVDVIDQNAPQGVHLCGEGGSWASVLREIVFKSYLRMVARCFHEHLGGRLRVQSLSAAEGVQTVSKVYAESRIRVLGGGGLVREGGAYPLAPPGRTTGRVWTMGRGHRPRVARTDAATEKLAAPPKTAPPTTPYSSRKNFINYLFYLIFH